jgi:glycosyltransferase involved in cell wall biosynthesis
VIRVDLVCQYFPPEPGAPSQRWRELGKRLARAGDAVVVLTAFPNHPTGRLPPEYHRRLFSAESFEGMTVWRHALYVTPNEGFLRKTVSHLSFMASVLLQSAARHPRPEVVVGSSPAFFALFAAWVRARLARAAFVVEVRDLWPGIFIDLGILRRGFLYSMIEALELFLYGRADAIVALTQGFAEDIRTRTGDSAKVHVITNGALDAVLPTPEAVRRRRLAWELAPEEVAVLYLGAHGISQGLTQVVEAARLCPSRIRFVFVGDGADKARVEAAAAGQRNVLFLSSVSSEDVAECYAAADICLAPLRDLPDFHRFIPSKIFEILAHGRPLIACLRGEAAEILGQTDGAIVVPPESPGVLAQAIEELACDSPRRARMGKSGQQFVLARYSYDALTARYREVLQQVITR